MKFRISPRIMSLVMGLILLLGQAALAEPLSEKQKKTLEGQTGLREQMDKMILSIADMDILVNRDKINDYEIFKEDAERILGSVAKIREMDPEKVFKPFLDTLEKNAAKLRDYAVKKDPRTAKVSEDIFNSCFKCHQAHRSY